MVVMTMLLAGEAATDSPITDPLSQLLQYGVLGVIVVLLIAYARTSIKRENDRADKAESQVLELNTFIRDELLPKQVEATIQLKATAEVMEEAVRHLSEANKREQSFYQNYISQQQLPPIVRGSGSHDR